MAAAAWLTRRTLLVSPGTMLVPSCRVIVPAFCRTALFSSLVSPQPPLCTVRLAWFTSVTPDNCGQYPSVPGPAGHVTVPGPASVPLSTVLAAARVKVAGAVKVPLISSSASPDISSGPGTVSEPSITSLASPAIVAPGGRLQVPVKSSGPLPDSDGDPDPPLTCTVSGPPAWMVPLSVTGTLMVAPWVPPG